MAYGLLGSGIVLRVGKEVKTVSEGDSVLLSFAHCKEFVNICSNVL
jgi:Zn-dependent alcohol dehydrogenase